MSNNLTPQEYDKIKKILKRSPNALELKLFEALWNEHCSYKSTNKWIKKLYNKNSIVLHSFGENAGAIDIGNEKALVFKIESHNHPSFINPYHGAATGVGGILRDIFVMGAKPIAIMNSLRFGDIKHNKTKHFCKEITKGISAYSNSFGVPTIGGEVEFDNSYNENILVNIFAAGLVSKNKIITNNTNSKNFSIYYMGAPTATDGLGGAIMASSTLSNDNNKLNIQLAQPFIGRCCYEAFLELLQNDAIIASTDLGASGLSCAISELAMKNNVGIELNLNNVPSLKNTITTEQLLFSETQERILVILKVGTESLAKNICEKWNIKFANIAHTTTHKSIYIKHNNNIIAKLPINIKAPIQHHSYSTHKAPLPIFLKMSNESISDTLLKLLSLPNLAAKNWFYNQFDSFIQGNTILHPGDSCGIVKIDNIKKAIAFKIDSKPIFCAIDAYKGAIASVVKCWRAINAVGGIPLAVTNNLNFGAPTNTRIMGQIIDTIKGLNRSCKTLNLPIISGNVSLYNETNNKSINPTPVIAAVGTLETWNKNKVSQGDIIYLIGAYPKKLRSSVLYKIHKEIGVYPPNFNLKKEMIYGEFVRNLVLKNIVKNCQPMAAGGILVVLSKMIINIKMGINLTIPPQNLFTKLFSEENAKYIMIIAPKKEKVLRNLAIKKNIKLQKIGIISRNEFQLEKIFNIDINTLINNFKLGIYNGLKLRRN